MDFLERNKNDFTFTFKNIHYEVELLNKETNEYYTKNIIADTTSQGKSGEIMAIMGPSGSGKTSLLNFITNRVEFGSNSKHSGSLYINSEEISFEDIPNYSAYVMQDDVLFDILTPYESIWYSCKLRKIVEDDKIEECVQGMINDLQLTGCKDTFIGSHMMKGVSGGERKRTSIGIEMISNPEILFLDEPTSGLDSQTSYQIISLLKRIAKEKNILVVCTIHQPSSNIFNMFDKLLIVEKGNMIYNDTPTNIVPYFESVKKPINPHVNPADGFMRILEENSMGDKPSYFIDTYQEEVKRNEKAVEEYLRSTKVGNNIHSKNTKAADYFEASLILSKRAFQNVVRNPMILRMRFGFNILMSFFISSVFWKLDKDNSIGMYGRVGLFFFIAVNVFMSVVMGTILSFPIERAVFIREYSSKLYTIASYYTAKNIVETPVILIINTILFTICYFTAGMRLVSAKYFFIWYGVLLLHTLCAQSLGYALGTMFSDINAAMSSANIIVMPFILFAGTLINEESMPRFLFWIKYLSPLKYAIETLSRNELQDNSEITYLGGGNEFLDTLNFELTTGTCIGILAGMIFLYRIMAYIFLKLLVRKAG